MNLKDRFIKYIAIDSMSDEESGTHPSSKKQFDFAEILISDLKELGVIDIEYDPKCYVYAHVNNNKEKTIGLIAHMDTSPSFKGGINHPKEIKNYDGKPIILNKDSILDPEVFPSLKEVIGEDLLVTDGYHLLGGDDKAGIAIIFEFLKYYLDHKDEFNYNLSICFTPDEEIGEGSLFFDCKKMKADYAFTLDGGSVYEANYENFNASEGKVTFKGINIHPGDAYNVMVNSIQIAAEFAALFKDELNPSTSKDHDGYIHLEAAKGELDNFTLHYIFRDFYLDGLEEKEKLFANNIEVIKNIYPKVKVEYSINRQYLNMKPLLIASHDTIDLINKAYIATQNKLSYVPIRGGTDGASITFKGLPCPNLGVGDFNPHGKYEFVSLTQMSKMVEILKEIFK